MGRPPAFKGVEWRADLILPQSVHRLSCILIQSPCVAHLFLNPRMALLIVEDSTEEDFMARMTESNEDTELYKRKSASIVIGARRRFGKPGHEAVSLVTSVNKPFPPSPSSA
jgi:hypothetical protein